MKNRNITLCFFFNWIAVRLTYLDIFKGDGDDRYSIGPTSAYARPKSRVVFSALTKINSKQAREKFHCPPVDIFRRFYNIFRKSFP